MERIIRYQAAIVQQHHVLLLQVTDGASGRTFWLLPGGGREAGETEEACVQREVCEETSLQIAVERPLFEAPDIAGGTYQRQRTYLCRVVGGEPRPGYEPEVDTAEHVTIRATGWFDLRTPETWGCTVLDNPFTRSLLDRLRVALDYAPSGSEP